MLKHGSEPGRLLSHQIGRFNHSPGRAFENESNSIDFHEIFRIIQRRAVVVLIIAGLFAGMGYLYANQLVPRYTSQAKLLINARKTQVINAQDVVSGLGGDHAAITSELELIKSTDVATRVVRKLGLANRAEFMSPKKRSLLDSLLPWRDSTGSSSSSSSDLLSDERRERIAIGRVKSGANVRRRGFSYVITVSYTATDPGLAAEIANSIVDEYLVDQLEARFEATRRANEWLNERLQALRTKLRDSERAVELFKTQNNIVDNEGTTLSDQQITKLNEQLILARAETAQAKANYQQVLAARKRGTSLASFADTSQTQVINDLRSKVSDVRRELANLRAKYGSRHPSVVAARAQLADFRRQLGGETSRIVTAAENRLRVAKSREESVAASIAQLKGATGAQTDQAEVKLRELKREAAANRALFESFLARFKEVSETETLKKEESRVIERAAVPGGASYPNKNRIMMAAAFVGLIMGAAIAFLLERMDAGFRTSDQIEKIIGAPVLAMLPRATEDLEDQSALKYLKKLDFISPLLRLMSFGKLGATGRSNRKRRAMARLVVEKPLSTFTEGIRALRMGLKYAEVDHPPKLVLISSALPGEGKSTIASNLAQHAANSGERVLLIDMDLRHPVTTGLYAGTATRGLVDLILNEADFESVVHTDPVTGLDVIPSPRASDLTHTAEILGSQRVRDILQDAAAAYDLVILDASPLLPVTDGRALMESVDGVVLVVQWESTSREAVKATFRQTLGLEDKLIGVVLNDVVAERARYYDYYKSGYYMKKYPYYYGGAKKA